MTLSFEERSRINKDNASHGARADLRGGPQQI